MPSAKADLQEYADIVALDSPQRAIKWLDSAMEVILSLSEMPFRYAVIDESKDIGVELRDVVHYSHRIVYRVKEDEGIVEVLRVWHGVRRPMGLSDL